jgi:internalin A
MSQGQENFRVEALPEGNTLVVTGPWSREAADLLKLGEVNGLDLNYAKGFCESDLEFFEEWPLRRLHVLDRKLADLDPIRRVAPSLKEFSVQAGPEARMDFIAMPILRSLVGYWWQIRPLLENVESLRTLITFDFDEVSLLPLIDQPSLEKLTLKAAPRIENLQGLNAFASLSFLGIHLTRKFTDISEFSGSHPVLQELKFEYCSQFSSLVPLQGLTGLRRLMISDCKKIDSLKPLAGLSKLEAFMAWGTTRIIDGDLSVLCELPELKELRMQSRKEYRPSLEEVKQRLQIT